MCWRQDGHRGPCGGAGRTPRLAAQPIKGPGREEAGQNLGTCGLHATFGASVPQPSLSSPKMLRAAADKGGDLNKRPLASDLRPRRRQASTPGLHAGKSWGPSNP